MPNFFDHPSDKGFVKSFDGLQIYWEQHGPKVKNPKNKAILFCYGLACSKYQWKNVAQIFAKDHACIFFDYRGHHRSEFVPNEQGLNMSYLARDAASVLNAAGAKSAHVFGHSMGCNVALELAFAEPTLVDSLVLVAGAAESPFASMMGMSFVGRIMPGILKTFPQNKDNFYLIWKWILKNRPLIKLAVMMGGFNRKAVESQDIETYLDSVATVSPHVFFELLLDLSKGNSQTLLPRIITPALVVSGATDQVTPPEVQHRLAAGLPHSEYFSIPLGSHNVQLEFADYLSRKIIEFWSQRLPKAVIRKTREKKS